MTRRSRHKWQSIKAFYRLYTAGLSRAEIERLLKRESADVYSFYRRGGAALPDQRFPRKQLSVVRELFVSFVMKLTPARRLFYGIAILIFCFAVVTGRWWYASLAFLTLNLLLAFEVADKMLAKDELEIAREIQMGLQPENHPRVGCLDISAFYQPAREVGGDYYDIAQLDEHRIAVMIGDVSGKGMPAALYAVKLQGLFESLTSLLTSPKDILVRMNESIKERLQRTYFMTAVLAFINTESGKMRLARAGHNAPIYYNARKQKVTLLKPTGLGIGLADGDIFAAELAEKEIPLTQDDILVFYTDGIVEAMNAAKEQFGEERLARLVAENSALSAKDLQDKIVYDLSHFCSRALLDDDATLVVMKNNGTRIS